MNKTLTYLLLLTLCIPVVAADALDRKAMAEKKREAWRQRFPQSDTDGDGKLSREEMQTYRFQGVRAPRKPAEIKPTFQFSTSSEILTTPTFSNVSYGKHKRQTFDLWQAPSTDNQPTPLVIFFHGGGFVSGEKSQIPVFMMQDFIRSGVSVASANYRYATDEAFPASLRDGARAVQFLRAHAEEYNIDPQLIGVMGESVGGGIALWVGMHDDLADAKSDNPTAHASSRVVAVAVRNGQSSYDPQVLADWTAPIVLEHPSFPALYPPEKIQEMSVESRQALYDECSAITHLTQDDPPVFQRLWVTDWKLSPNGWVMRPKIAEDVNAHEAMHHPFLGVKLKEQMDAMGITSEIQTRSDLSSNMGEAELIRFFLKEFAKAETENLKN